MVPGRAALLGAALALCAAGSLAASPPAPPQADARTLLSQAEQGDPRAAFLLGTRFADGREGPRDDSEAARWFRQAAQAGLAEAQYNLGILHAAGRGVERDLQEAVRWYRLAAEQELAEAQHNLALMYGTGTGVERDLERAAALTRRAAEAGLAPAQHNLGVLAEFGRGMPRAPRTALQWYERSAAQGYEPAAARLAALRARLGVDAGAAGAARSASGPDPPVAAAAPPKRGPFDPLEWTAALDPDRYTVQLVSYRDAENARAFLARHFEPGEAGYFASEQAGRRWYSVVYGEYASFKAARAAAAALPEPLRRGDPWVRKVRIVHATMVP